MPRSFIPAILILLVSWPVTPQLSRGGKPLNLSQSSRQSGHIHELPPLPEDAVPRPFANGLHPGNKSYVFAHAYQVDLDPETSGKWSLQTGYFDIWQLTLRSRNAFSIGVIFKEFELTEGARLFLFNQDRSRIIGALTSSNNKAWGRLAVSHIPGDEITMQLEVPSHLNGKYGKLRIGSVAHAFEDIHSAADPGDDRWGTSDTCNVDISCKEGDDWQLVRRSVCRVIINNVQLCTGCLVNNTLNDGTPYVYFAQHCFEKKGVPFYSAEDAIFCFNYESPSCNGEDGPTGYSISGSTKLAGGDSVDFALVEMSVAPPDSFRVYYAGWNRGTEAPCTTACIHHPRGDVKKISLDRDPPESSYHKENYYPEYVLYSHWRILEWDVGTTQVGSSGGPLFDQEKRIVGSLTGGEASCVNNVNDYFTKFSYAWDYYPEPHRQLKHWLDPGGNNVMAMEGYDPVIKNLPGEVVPPGIRVFPNPTSGMLHLELTEHTDGQILVRIYTLDGKILCSAGYRSIKNIQLDIENLASGLYILTVRSGGRLYTYLISRN